MHERESPKVRRERRKALYNAGFAAIVMRLRALSSIGASVEVARHIRDCYAHVVLGFGPGVGGDAFIDFLLSDDAGDEDEGDLDGRFMALKRSQIDAATHGAGAVRQAMRGQARTT